MQTFLPYPDFDETVQCLDWRRLGKQRVEADQILAIIDGRAARNKELKLRQMIANGEHIRAAKYSKRKIGHINHPIIKMWRGYEDALIAYRNCCIEQWIERGYNNTMPIIPVKNIVMPPWIGNEEFHASHRANLLRKDPEWYGQFDWVENPEMPYVWF